MKIVDRPLPLQVLQVLQVLLDNYTYYMYYTTITELLQLLQTLHPTNSLQLLHRYYTYYSLLPHITPYYTQLPSYYIGKITKKEYIELTLCEKLPSSLLIVL